MTQDSSWPDSRASDDRGGDSASDRAGGGTSSQSEALTVNVTSEPRLTRKPGPSGARRRLGRGAAPAAWTRHGAGAPDSASAPGPVTVQFESNLKMSAD